jgi:hypothetical protein
MENRDRDKMSQSKSDSSVDFGKKIGQSENKLNEPSSRTSGSVGSSGMESGSSNLAGSKSGSSSDLGSSSISSDKDKSSGTWGDKGSQGGSRH